MEKRKQGRPFKKAENKLVSYFPIGLYEKERENIDKLIRLNINVSHMVRLYINKLTKDLT